MVNYLREFQSAAGVPRDKLYDSTMYVLCAMLIAGLICNWLIKPVNRKWRMSEAEVARLQAASAKSEATIQHGSFGIDKGWLDLGCLQRMLGTSATRLWKARQKSSDRAP